MTLEICPSCGVYDSMFVPSSVAVLLNGQPVGGRTEAFCNNAACDQRYWYYPLSRRVTRRNTGPRISAQNWCWTDLARINALRRRQDLPELQEVETVDVVICEPGPEHFELTIVDVPNVARLRRQLYEKWCYMRAYFVIYWPWLFGRFSVCKDEGDDDE